MKAYLIVMFMISIFVVSCSFSSGDFMIASPSGLGKEERIKIGKECLVEAKEKSRIELTDDEKIRVKGIETARYFEGGRGHNRFSDRYILCFLNRGFKKIRK